MCGAMRNMRFDFDRHALVSLLFSPITSDRIRLNPTSRFRFGILEETVLLSMNYTLSLLILKRFCAGTTFTI